MKIPNMHVWKLACGLGDICVDYVTRQMFPKPHYFEAVACTVTDACASKVMSAKIVLDRLQRVLVGPYVVQFAPVVPGLYFSILLVTSGIVVKVHRLCMVRFNDS